MWLDLGTRFWRVSFFVGGVGGLLEEMERLLEEVWGILEEPDEILEVL